ncbi:hypothetical protein PIB30_018598 [Stylosanthes scabra]|uniref:Uncharacterized protein n=1 Tax=Stylosanthes scabra TaxID=79078 RepID=A0ABU6S7U1_9FABA|nr:hypothetical protein [Stylosanthes scabra]
MPSSSSNPKAWTPLRADLQFKRLMVEAITLMVDAKCGLIVVLSKQDRTGRFDRKPGELDPTSIRSEIRIVSARESVGPSQTRRNRSNQVKTELTGPFGLHAEAYGAPTSAGGFENWAGGVSVPGCQPAQAKIHH